MPDRTEHRLPPQNLEAEMSVLGGVLLENEALNRALEHLRPTDFYRAAHSKIFTALITLSDRGEPADLVTLTAVLKEHGTFEEVGGSSYLSTLVDFVPTAANIVYYCKLVKEKAISRELIKVGIAMGAGLDRSLAALYKRLPLQEVNFFAIVLMIQSKAGGNLSEALGNLSTVIRSRKMMREKVSALSSEAKASGMIIGSLPFAVGTMVFMTTPDYIMELFLTETGHVILVIAAVMMGLGITVMRNMINFDM